MHYGLFLSANGAAAQSTRLDVIANNLANAGTTGFKRDLALFQANHTFDAEHDRFQRRPHAFENHTGGPTLEAVRTDYGEGPLQRTGNAFDLALTGPGFLQVSSGDRTYLTRDGRLTVTDEGELVSRATGHRVLGTDARPILVAPTTTDLVVDADGTLSEVDVEGHSVVTNRIGLHEPASWDALSKQGDGLFLNAGHSRPAGPNTRLHQGFLEASSTNPTSEMMQMIDATRAFEANVNMIRYQDEALGRLLQAVPR